MKSATDIQEELTTLDTHRPLMKDRCRPHKEKQMDASQLMAAARSRTGLDDFGADHFREPLERLVASINAESILSEIGKVAIPDTIIRHLMNRLAVEDWYHRHPEIEEQEIVAPLFIVGMPRTGSTALGHLLALDPETRSLRQWEAAQPCPPPEAATRYTDPRIEITRVQVEAFDRLVPGVREALPRSGSALAPEECWTLFDLSLTSLANEGFVHVPSYIAWLRSPGFDMTPAYRYHKRVLKLLQWRCPPTRWQLRSPTQHLYSIETLNTVYPDARFVMTHRDPTKTLPSVCSLMHQVREVFLAEPFPKLLGREMVDTLQVGLERMLRFRDRVGEARFFDISHREQVKDPVPQIRALYAWLGWRFDGAMEARISQWRKDNPKGTHKPEPAFFGIDLDEIRQRYRPYVERFSALL